METVSQFAGRYKTSSTVESIRVKNAHRKSLTRKESRYNQLRKSRKFGLSDFSPLKENCITTGQENDVFQKEVKPAQKSVKPLPQARKELLQRYKSEKQLKKMQEEREKARGGVFRVGMYKPDAPCFLPSESTLMKTKPNQVEKIAPTQAGPVTRLTVKNLSEQPKNATAARSQTTKIPCLSTFGTANRKGQKENTIPVKAKIEQSHSTRPVTALKESKVLRGSVIAAPKVPAKTTNPEVLHSRLTRATASFAAKVQPKANVQVDVPHARTARPAVSTAKLQNKTSTHLPVKKSSGMVQQKNENKTGSAAKGNLYDRVDELHTIAEMQSELPSVDLVVKTCQNVYDGDAERISDPQQDTSVEVGLFQCSGALENASGASLSTVAEETEEKCQTAAGHSKRKGRISFAPQHFVFQPLEGISSYKFNPMTPHSTEKFLSPCFTWSPLEAKRDKHLKLEDHMISVEQHRADATATLQKEMKISKNALEEEMKEFSQSAPEEEMDVSESDPEEEEMKDISEIDQQKEEMKDVSRDLPVEEMKGVSEDAHVEEIKGASEDVPVEEMKGVSEDVPVEEMKGISENAPVEKMKGVSEDVPVEEMKGISENAPVEEMKGVSEDAPVEEMNGVSEDALVEKIKDVSSCVVEDVIKEEPLKEVGSVIEVMPTPSVFAQEASGTAEKLCSIQTLDNVHDVPYFRNAIQSESDRLLFLARCWEEKMELDIPDEAKDLIRTTVGQTRLLIAERFKQFEGLVDDCEFKCGEKETTCTDLDGFWDMVSFQVEDVNKKYEKLVNLETSGWKPSLPQVQAKKLVKKKAVVGVSSKPGPSDGGRAAAKSRLAAIKASMKAKLKQEETTEASSERVENADMVVFDAGFFMVESPAKHFNGSTSKMHANISSGKCRPQTVTPRSISRTAKRSCIMSFASPINNPLQSTEITHTFTPLPVVNVGEQLERIVAEESECGNMRHCIQTNNECVAINCQKSCLPAKLTSTEFNSCPSPMTAKVTDIMVNSADTVSSDVLMCSPEKESMLEKAPEQSDASLSVKQSNELQSLYSAGLSHTDTFPAASGDGIHSQLETHGNPTPLEMAGLNCITSPSNQNLALASTITDDLIVFSPVGTPFHP